MQDSSQPQIAQPSARKRAGFTMAELIIASGLLILGVLGIFGAAIASIRTQHMSSNLYHATCLARNRVQRGLALPFNTLPVLAATDQAMDKDGNTNADGPFRMTTILTSVSDHCYSITVQVHYPIGGGRMSEIPAVIESKIARGMHSEEIEE